MPKCAISSPSGWTAEIYTHGAHVTSWKSPTGQEQLFLSEQAIFHPPTAIRGGIPICWPQFGDMGPCKAQHGFARNTTFEVTESKADSITLELRGEADTFSDFPHPYILTCKVTVSDGSLEQELRVHNPSSTDSLPFTAALHTYFRLLHGSESVTVLGLSGCKYLDNLQNRKECLEEEEPVKLNGEVDRIYLAVPDSLRILDGGEGAKSKEGSNAVSGHRTIEIEKSGFQDAVLWNPHVIKASKMKDFGDEEWKDMVCVEVAQAGSGAIEVGAGQSWVGRQKLTSNAISQDCT